MPTEMGLNLPLEQMVQGPLEVNPTPELEMEEREGQQEDSVEEAVPEDIEVGVGMDPVDREAELSEDTLGSDSDREDNEELVLAEDNRLEYWAWAHDWEDLDWEEDVWLEDETVSADLDEAVLPDELWD